MPAGFAGPTFDTPTGAYDGEFYGPVAEETAGQWHMRESYVDASMGQMTVVGSFGARREAAARRRRTSCPAQRQCRRCRSSR
nr:hypothetical protein [uncultured Brevundimonas sp.]